LLSARERFTSCAVIGCHFTRCAVIGSPPMQHSLLNSGATRNFVREGPITWRTFDCSLRLFANS